MIREYQVRLTPQQAYSNETIAAWLAQNEGFDVRTVTHIRVLKRSIDARQRQIFVNLQGKV